MKNLKIMILVSATAGIVLQQIAWRSDSLKQCSYAGTICDGKTWTTFGLLVAGLGLFFIITSIVLSFIWLKARLGASMTKHLS